MTAEPQYGRATEHATKRERVLAVLDGVDADAVWLTSPAALGWYLDGARVHTSLVGPPIAAVRVSRDGDAVRVFSNEVERLRAEELPSGIPVETVEWHEPLLPPGRPGPRELTEADVEAELRAARASLLPIERARYAALSATAARLATDVLGAARPDHSEQRLAGDLAAALVEAGADPLVTMVAGGSRLGFRHPLPTAAPLGRRAMVVVCARRSGLIANLTRWVGFGPDDAPTARRSAALRSVESDMLRATRPGARLSDILAEAAAAYPRHGFDDGEWRRHHQGGAAGYAGRDPRATPLTLDLVQPGQAFAWNPTASGVKIEDTVIVDADGIDVLTTDPRWPTVRVDGLDRPEELRP